MKSAEDHVVYKYSFTSIYAFQKALILFVIAILSWMEIYFMLHTDNVRFLLQFGTIIVFLYALFAVADILFQEEPNPWTRYVFLQAILWPLFNIPPFALVFFNPDGRYQTLRCGPIETFTEAYAPPGLAVKYTLTTVRWHHKVRSS